MEKYQWISVNHDLAVLLRYFAFKVFYVPRRQIRTVVRQDFYAPEFFREIIQIFLISETGRFHDFIAPFVAMLSPPFQTFSAARVVPENKQADVEFADGAFFLFFPGGRLWGMIKTDESPKAWKIGSGEEKKNKSLSKYVIMSISGCFFKT